MMKQSEKRGWVGPCIAACCILGAAVTIGSPKHSAAIDLGNFDHQGQKVFRSYEATPETYLAADSGDRNLARFYELRQYPGSPPRIPHGVEASFSGDESNCLSCHGKGGYSPEFGKFVPVTPHPENTLCYQCHARVITEKAFGESDWQSIRPPRLGRSFLSSSPPPIPHSLQLRENCISCHTGPGAVVEIRVEHSSRGNCRQCHVPAVQTAPVNEFVRPGP
ncbi:cytochrome c3 family protein [Desulfogranum mediterraneum]|uniref:cytochrome c3 family protein n=1 Tax=Desulfogranum mediterraneum TaxID=160661 RepID=UPI00041BACAD|nr:cytochrome c3 family protein [Desulfogranum mediterraneum]